MGEWKSIRLKDIANKVREKNSSEEYDVVFSNSALNGIVIQTDFFDKEIANKANLKNYTVVKENDFVYNPRISRLAPCGPINKNNTQYTGLVSPLYKVFRVDAEKCNLNYIEHYFSSSVWHRYMNSVANYGARSDRMNITDVNFFNLKIKLPNPKEQEKIASILSTWDKAIELKEKLIEQKKEQKKGLMQKLLTGEVRLPGFEGEWKEWRLGDLGTFIRGKGIPKRDTVEEGINCILYGEIYTTHNFYIKEFISFINREIANKSVKINKNDILFASSGETAEEIGKAVAYLHSDEAYAGGDIIILRPQVEVNSLFLSFLVNVGDVARKITKLGQGHSVVHIYPSTLTDLKVKLPPVEEQNEISNLLKKIDQNIELIEQMIEELDLQKKGLMQLLLTGKVRVKV